MALTGTWLSPGNIDKIETKEATPEGYVFKHVPRAFRGVGVAVIYRKSNNLKSNAINKFKSFEYMDVTLESSSLWYIDPDALKQMAQQMQSSTVNSLVS